VVTLKDVENFFLLVQQRVSEQNNGQLIQFTVLIRFDNGTSVELQSLEQLHAYSEIRPVVSVGVGLTWVYLVSFRELSVPERQQIEVEISTDAEFSASPRLLRMSLKEYQAARSAGILTYRISHTARTWGADIENLLRTHIENIVIKETGLRQFVRKWDKVTRGVIAIAFLGGVLAGGKLLFDALSRRRYQEYYAITKLRLSPVDLLQHKIDWLSSNVTGPDSVVMIVGTGLFLVAAMLGSIFIAEWLIERGKAGLPSFVLLSRAAEKNRIENMLKYKNNWRTFLIGFFVAVGAGILGN
jgi:hypothetical protein